MTQLPNQGDPAGPPAGRPDRPADPGRRRLLGTAALGTVGLLAGGVAGYGIRAATESAPAGTGTAGDSTDPANSAGPDNGVVPFYGARQAGITTRQQEQMMFAAFDVTTMDVRALQQLLGRWAAVASRYTQGQTTSGGEPAPNRPPDDTGEGMDLGAHSLTITVGFGASLFDERFGLTDKMPAALRPFGMLPGEGDMKADISGGDLCVQACADDPQVVFHAVRNLTRIARGTAVLRWSQLGFGRASATGTGQTTPRNLFGFKDGTRNIHADESADLEADVWVGQETDQEWMSGGSYLIARKIGMIIESWDATVLSEQERIFGRAKQSGAPLSGGTEFTAPNFGARTGGADAIDVNAHIRLAAAEQNNGVRILRRGYNYTDGQDATGRLDAGLFFIAFQKDPEQFKVLQTKLGAHDLLNEYIVHLGGGTWACPPGVSKAGDWFGKALFG
ncbi:iron uptake transporter deferrochelatase/peroxidase subunit [Nakamurella lactea]|uniref:iron uptake transporter deferrochelatase/peroxidase subunit n=1 Tax=Nakamurella lactea TaxID=459515 RepID=UPI0004016AD9|nr:iron uptake transporter deferrochelatase/peroxidase subunit [Nakamurella lactea]